MNNSHTHTHISYSRSKRFVIESNFRQTIFRSTTFMCNLSLDISIFIVISIFLLFLRHVPSVKRRLLSYLVSNSVQDQFRIFYNLVSAVDGQPHQCTYKDFSLYRVELKAVFLYIVTFYVCSVYIHTSSSTHSSYISCIHAYILHSPTHAIHSL